ncbi:FCD domain-containing protein [Shewanella sp. 10N.7]|uniref:GntR family transcriptional regulator n=1 Tax=Shewanella sp. 10N.7 TaxID=2885093 RepID=UPI001E4DE381|nr:FCD domain-containing protein [Shewanella sp. 10N.7]MCC4831793.1 FCD domain-containing protein [Shewanella sp. 10N.7]
MASNKTYLFKQSINRMLTQIEELPEGQYTMANDMELTRQLNISRTTVRACIEHLINNGLVKREGSHKIVLRQPEDTDFFDIENKASTKDEQIEKYFMSLIHHGELLPGDRFSELSLAKNSGCTTISVREFLIKFSNNGLIKKIPRGRWQMVEFDEAFAKELIDFREMLEMNALNDLLRAPKDDVIWSELADLLRAHQEVRADMENRYMEFPDLDKAFHFKLRDKKPNRFINQFYDIVSFICHYHYQWDKNGELERFTVACNEHIAILENLISNDHASAVLAMKQHLESAKKTLMGCVHGLEV